jgi:putative ATPase
MAASVRCPALGDIRKGNIGQIPDHLRDGHYAGAKDLGRAIGYKYLGDNESSITA